MSGKDCFRPSYWLLSFDMRNSQTLNDTCISNRKVMFFFPMLIHSDIRATIDIFTAVQVSFFLLLRNRENPSSILCEKAPATRIYLHCSFFFLFFLAVESFKPKVDTFYFTCI